MPDSKPLPARIARGLRALVQKARGKHDENRSNLPLLSRWTAHLGIVALVILGLLLSGVEIRAAGPETGNSADPNAVTDLGPITLEDEANSGNLTLAAIPITIVQKAPAKPRLEVVQYTVGSGDTVTRIANRFNISADSVLWANAKLEDNPDMLSIGQSLYIPPTSGVLYTVQKGDTIEAVANRFKAKSDNIFNDPFNQSNHDFKINPPNLVVGNFLMVPGGQKPFVVKKPTITGAAPQAAPKGTTNFVGPVGACLTQLFGGRHTGVDLAAPTGTPVRAADSGYAAVVGWDNTGYGNMILLNHGNGYLTRYGHLSAFNIRPGQAIKKGDLIGRVGSTGHSTGPHLHFEIILNGAFRNPAYYIKIPGWCPGYR